MSDAHNKVGELADVIEAMSEACRRVRVYPDLVKALREIERKDDPDDDVLEMALIARQALAKAGETL